MRHATPTLYLLLALAFSTASAQVVTRLGPTKIGLSEYDINGLAGQPVTLPLVIANKGSAPLRVGNVMQDGSIPCPKFKVFDRADGSALTSNAATDCVTGATITLKPGERRKFTVQIPFPLRPGEYTAVMTVPTLPKPTVAKANVRIGPGPFIAELRLPQIIKANKPHVLEVVFTNVWRSTAQDAFNLCHDTGLLIRRTDGEVVHNLKADICADNLDGANLAPGQQTTRKQHLPALPVGKYTAILWGKFNASKAFEVKP